MNSTNPIKADPMDDKFESEYVSMWKDGNILCCTFKGRLHLTLEIAKACVEARIFFARGKSYPLLVDMRNIKSTTKEARQYMATMGATLVTAGALITGSAINRALGNLFLTVDKPTVPTRLFTSEASARQWLSQFT